MHGIRIRNCICDLLFEEKGDEEVKELGFSCKKNILSLSLNLVLTVALLVMFTKQDKPEFLHLFMVGIMYVSVYHITRNLLIIFPFFWGIGALWDVLVSSDSGNGIKNITSFGMAVSILVMSLL